MKKVIKITLDADTAEFLEAARSAEHPDSVSRFINSLLRQERFRQGFPAYQGPYPSEQPMRNPVEKHMLTRSGLLPLNPRYR